MRNKVLFIGLMIVFFSLGCVNSETESPTSKKITKEEPEKLTKINIFVDVKDSRHSTYFDVANAFLRGENEVFASLTVWCFNQTGGYMWHDPDYTYLESIKKGTNVSNVNIIKVEVLGYYNILEHLKRNYDFYEYVKNSVEYSQKQDDYPSPVIIAETEIRDPNIQYLPCRGGSAYKIPITNETFRKMLEAYDYVFNFTVTLIDGRTFNYITSRHVDILNCPRVSKPGLSESEREAILINEFKRYPLWDKNCPRWYETAKYRVAELEKANNRLRLEKEKSMGTPRL